MALWAWQAPPPPAAPAPHLGAPLQAAVLCAVVGLHATALALAAPRRSGPAALLRFPAAGGRNTAIFQALSWASFAASLAAGRAARRGAAPAPALAPEVPAVLACFSLLFMAKSILVFEPGGAAARERRRAARWNTRWLPSRAAASHAATAVGVAWAALGAALLAAPRPPGGAGRAGELLARYALAAAALTTGASITHGLGGALRHGGPAWRFWQPFRGGGAFVTLQAVGWALYGYAIVAIARRAAQLAAGLAAALPALGRGGEAAAAASALAAHVALAASLRAFRAGGEPLPAASPGAAAAPPPAATPADRARDAAVVALLYLAPHVAFAALLAPFVALPPARAVVALFVVLAPYYVATGRGAPAVTGRREWPAFRDWLGAAAERAQRRWLGSLDVVRDGGGAGAPAPLPPGTRYVFAYAPHGLYPLGAAYAPLLPPFRRLLPPGMRPVTLSASIVFMVPIIRDILQWLGLRVVSASSFSAALAERGAVVVCPGGQAELVETPRMHRKRGAGRECVVYTRHRGFARLALRGGAALVPVLALGEVCSLRNLLHVAPLVRWTVKRLGVPFPYLVGGAAGFLPLPLPTGARFVVGDPIHPPPGGDGDEEARVAAFHATFYEQLAAMFERHKEAFGYGDVKLVLV